MEAVNLFASLSFVAAWAASSNVDNACRLEGKVLLVVGAMDHNVNPPSSAAVADAAKPHSKSTSATSGR